MMREFKYFGTVDLPKLVGSDKQNRWAKRIRDSVVFKAGNLIETTKQSEEQGTDNGPEKNSGIWKFSNEQVDIDHADLVVKAEEDFLNGLRLVRFSSWWIDQRETPLWELVCIIACGWREYMKEMAVDKQREEVITPEHVKKYGYAKITVVVEKGVEKIIASYEYDEDFRYIVESNKYKWNHRWVKITSFRTEKTEDRVIEIASRLYNNGFAVCVPLGLKDKIIKGEYKCEKTSWIWSGDYKGTVIIDVPFKGSYDYYEAKQLSGAMYDGKKGMHVPTKYYKEIRHFARMKGYGITEEADKYLKLAEQNDADKNAEACKAF